jgi:predicted transcriptional regulator
MPGELDEIKRIRKKLGLTQTQLAKKSSVSQSLIAKIESGKLDPGYIKTKQIFDALENLTQDDELIAAQVMKKKVFTAAVSDHVDSIIRTMKKHAISQIPVLEHGKPVGLISERTILDSLSKGEHIKHKKAQDIMDDCPPIVTKNTKLQVIAQLLRYFSIVLVAEKGHLKGLISKADVIVNIT